jgi:hypothetical protein
LAILTILSSVSGGKGFVFSPVFIPIAPIVSDPKFIPLAPNKKMSEICIHENPNVEITDFLSVLQEGIRLNGLQSAIYYEIPSTCAYVLEYMAIDRGAPKPYMIVADVKLYEGRELVGSVGYRLREGVFDDGGKWDSTKEKLDPLLDALFAYYSPGHNFRSVTVTSKIEPVPPAPSFEKSQVRKLWDLKRLYNAGSISSEEYLERQKTILSNP